MKFKFAFYLLSTLLIASCSKSENDESNGGDGNMPSIEAEYALLLKKDNKLSVQFLNANANTITLNPNESSLAEKIVPNLYDLEGANFLQYHRTGNCQGSLTKYNFSNDSASEMVVFSDLGNCNINVLAIAQSANTMFISYETAESNSPDYTIRIIDATSADFSYEDVMVEKKPFDLATTNNKLFILTQDEAEANKNNVLVIDLSTNNLIHEVPAGNDAKRIFKDGSNNILISYEGLHGILNSTTMAVNYVRYREDAKPKFASTNSKRLDDTGRLYYPSNSGDFSDYPQIAAVYDFSQNLATFYAYENFLTEQKRDFELKIETTTAVGFDEENNLLLIGYKKTGEINKGGLLRVQTATAPNLVDNINLDGVPYEIVVK